MTLATARILSTETGSEGLIEDAREGWDEVVDMASSRGSRERMLIKTGLLRKHYSRTELPWAEPVDKP